MDTRRNLAHLFAQMLRNAMQSVDWPSVEMVAEELEGVSLDRRPSTAEDAGPSDADLLEWVMEHTYAGDRADERHRVWYIGRDFEQHRAEGASYREAILKAIDEDAAIAAPDPAEVARG